MPQPSPQPPGAPSRLRILQVASHAKVARGGAVQMLGLARELSRRGHAVHCVVHHPAGQPRSVQEDFAELFEAGLSVTAFDQDRWRDVLRFRRSLRRQPCDVIHAHRDRALAFAFLATHGMARPVLVANRGTTGPLKRWTWARRAFHSPRVGAVIAVSEAVKRALTESEGLDPARVHVVYGSVDLERFHPAVDGGGVRAEIGIGPDVPLITLAAALVPKKGHADFVRMIPHVTAALPGAHFLWVGEGRPAVFEEMTQGLEQRERLHWLGHRDDMPEVLAASSVVLCCSTHGEGLTGTLREALAVGRPVVTTGVSGNTEIVRPGETGLVVPPGDPEAMARAVIDTLNDPEAARRRTEAGRAWVLAECSEQVRADRVEAIYRRALASRPDAARL